MNRLLIQLVCLMVASQSATAFDDALYAELLLRHTHAVPDTAGTRVDYASIRSSAQWRRLIASLETTDPLPQSRSARLAFYINAYNVLAIDTVARGYPVDGIRELGSFIWPVWLRTAGRIAGQDVSLHEIEHEILRPMGEPRIHAAIVCAATSCPSLLREPWRADRLEAQFEAALRAWLRDPRKGVAIDRSRREIRLSRIFKWFSEDFEAFGGVIGFIEPHLAEADRRWLAEHGDGSAIEYLDYDWRLNDWPATVAPAGIR